MRRVLCFAFVPILAIGAAIAHGGHGRHRGYSSSCDGYRASCCGSQQVQYETCSGYIPASEAYQESYEEPPVPTEGEGPELAPPPDLQNQDEQLQRNEGIQQDNERNQQNRQIESRMKRTSFRR